jgi:hypothetical protein
MDNRNGQQSNHVQIKTEYETMKVFPDFDPVLKMTYDAFRKLSIEGKALALAEGFNSAFQISPIFGDLSDGSCAVFSFYEVEEISEVVFHVWLFKSRLNTWRREPYPLHY